jgi:hypothetical protein
LIAYFLFRSNSKKHTIIDKNPAKQSQSLQHHIAVSPKLMVSIKILRAMICKGSEYEREYVATEAAAYLDFTKVCDSFAEKKKHFSDWPYAGASYI